MTDENVEKNVTEKVEVDKKWLEDMMSRVERLENKDSEIDIVGADDGTEKPHTCRVKLIDGRPVTRVHSVVETGRDEFTKEPIMKCTVVTVDKDGKEKEHKGVDYKAFRNQLAVECQIVETKTKKMTKAGDLVDERVYDERSNNMIYTGRKVRLAVNYLATKHVVKIDGTDYELDNINL